MKRRNVIQSLAAGSMLMPGLLSELLAQDDSLDPLAPKQPHCPVPCTKHAPTESDEPNRADGAVLVPKIERHLH
jgi:hypothetical protein